VLVLSVRFQLKDGDDRCNSSGGNSSSIDFAIMHDRAARMQWSGVDKYVGATKNSYVIVTLA
jgi:hypothetical protein